MTESFNDLSNKLLECQQIAGRLKQSNLVKQISKIMTSLVEPCTKETLNTLASFSGPEGCPVDSVTEDTQKFRDHDLKTKPKDVQNLPDPTKGGNIFS